MRLFRTQYFLGLATVYGMCSYAQALLQPDIRADTNRDGVVDLQGDTDVANKAIWSSSRGAIFLPNIGDASHRCPTTDTKDNPLGDDEIAWCSDSSGDMLLSPEYAAPLATMPMVNISDEAYAYIYATPKAAYNRVRLFLNESGADSSQISWSLIDRAFTFDATQLRQGLMLALDGREVVKDTEIWDGNVIVQFDIHDGREVVSDVVTLKMAPVLTHHHLQNVDSLVTVETSNSTDLQMNFVSQLDNGRKIAGIDTPLLLLNKSDDIWAQDFLEPAYVSMPGPEGPVSIRIILRSAQPMRTAGLQAFEQLRGQGVGGFHPESGFGHEEMSSFGNLETIPPYTSKGGVAYKAGRIIMGKHFDILPTESMLTFLNSQGMQDPLILETGWLVVGHVDEFVQFLPFSNHLGWTIGIADTTSAMALLEKAQREGHGSTPASSFRLEGTPYNASFFDLEDLPLTIDDLLANETFREINRYAQRHIDYNLLTLLSEVDLPIEQVIRIPALFKNSDFQFDSNEVERPSSTPRVRSREFQLIAFSPGVVNGIVIGRHYLSPKPWGPVINGQDIFEKAVEAAYARANMTVSYVDDYLSHHVGGGEIHCGSNSLRQTDFRWWE